MTHIKIKPLSVNKAWNGRRFKSNLYKSFERELNLLLPKKIAIPDAPLRIHIEFGVSNMAMDWDNGIKQFQDVISKKYGFNDNKIHEGSVRKIKTKKGAEYIAFTIVEARTSELSFERWIEPFEQ